MQQDRQKDGDDQKHGDITDDGYIAQVHVARTTPLRPASESTALAIIVWRMVVARLLGNKGISGTHKR
jgi:hypothetical protein